MRKIILPTPPKRHECGAWAENGKVYYHCPLCSYKREYDPETGSMRLLDQGDPEALHRGTYMPVIPIISEPGKNN